MKTGEILHDTMAFF